MASSHVVSDQLQHAVEVRRFVRALRVTLEEESVVLAVDAEVFGAAGGLDGQGEEVVVVRRVPDEESPRGFRAEQGAGLSSAHSSPVKPALLELTHSTHHLLVVSMGAEGLVMQWRQAQAPPCRHGPRRYHGGWRPGPDRSFGWAGRCTLGARSWGDTTRVWGGRSPGPGPRGRRGRCIQRGAGGETPTSTLQIWSAVVRNCLSQAQKKPRKLPESSASR